MSARKGKRRVGQLQYRRFHAAFIWRSVEDIAWDNMEPVGREFGSPDYERLMQEDFENQTGLFDPILRSTYEPDDGPLTTRQYEALQRNVAARFPRGKRLWSKSLFESKELGRQVTETFATVAEASAWLHRPHPMLDGETPLVAAKNSFGEQRVKEILLSIRFGGNV